MSNSTDVTIVVDDRMRLMSAALAATDFPERAQERKRYFAHAHARATTKYIADKGLLTHPAIIGLQGMLDDNVPLETLYALLMHLTWPGLTVRQLPSWAPPKWNSLMWDFYTQADLATFWKNEAAVWDKAIAQSKTVFQKRPFKPFLQEFIGEFPEELVFEPNICYPADRELGVRVHNQVHAIVPPAQAWGDSPPLPYDEDTMLMHPIRAALTSFGRVLVGAYLRANSALLAEASKKELPVSEQFKALHPAWDDQFVTIFVAGAVAIYLEDFVDPREAKAYVLEETKARGMAILPGAVNVLRRYLQEKGNRYNTLAEFLPVFPVQLRVAKKIVTL